MFLSCRRFFIKTNEWIRVFLCLTVLKPNLFIRFLEEFEDTKKSFRNWLTINFLELFKRSIMIFVWNRLALFFSGSVKINEWSVSLPCSCQFNARVGNIWYLSPLVLSRWEDLAFSVSRLFEKSVFIIQFLNDKMHNYAKQNITKNFNIKKMNNKHTFLKTEKTKFSRWENLAFSVLRKVCLFFNFWIIKHTNALNKT